MHGYEFVRLSVEECKVLTVLVELITRWLEHLTFALVHVPNDQLATILWTSDRSKESLITAETDCFHHLLVVFNPVEDLKTIEVPDDQCRLLF
jgi:hypothetical protein